MNRILTDDEVDEIQTAKIERLEAESWKAINPLWRLVDPLSVRQAASLIAGFDPNIVIFNVSDDIWFERDGYRDSDGVGWVQTAYTALVNAINAGKLAATIRHNARQADWDEYPSINEDERVLDENMQFSPRILFCKSPDWSKTTVEIDNLRKWLKEKGMKSGFFFPDESAIDSVPGYLDPDNPRYSRKLAAAVQAWLAVTASIEAGNPLKRSAKQTLDAWLKRHANEFELTDDETGLPTPKAMEECSTVANWDTKGGAPSSS
ncbi:hypothetical protein LIN78_05330 [Leeia sp. TBRC 13508]|uniref:Uncharacterized protein n=1 Tax=Leeia speluncae TaxID=2884804 RepID=A0ABS8D437_9NEIS|nr:hypothetical protein [Leeia speluncae]MCB6182969.1 hypothetical protein [Leeia speluncae]